jgi:electron transfer flavoprotein alpha subunit
VKPRSIDDVPILALTLWSERYDAATLRRIAAQAHDAIKEVPDVSEVRIIGGQRRQVRVALDDARLAHYLADVYAQAIAALAKSLGAEYVLATATAMGKDLMPRVAARLDAPMASEIVAIGDDGTLIAMVGVSDLVVVKSGDAILVLPRSQAQDVRKVVEALSARGLARYL